MENLHLVQLRIVVHFGSVHKNLAVSSCGSPVCSTHQKLAKLRTVKDKMKQIYGCLFFACSERKNPSRFW